MGTQTRELLVHLAARGLRGPPHLRREGCGISQAHIQMPTPPQGPGQNPRPEGPSWYRDLSRSPTFQPTAPTLVSPSSEITAFHPISWTRPQEPALSLTWSLPSSGHTGTSSPSALASQSLCPGPGSPWPPAWPQHKPPGLPDFRPQHSGAAPPSRCRVLSQHPDSARTTNVQQARSLRKPRSCPGRPSVTQPPVLHWPPCTAESLAWRLDAAGSMTAGADG